MITSYKNHCIICTLHNLKSRAKIYESNEKLRYYCNIYFHIENVIKKPLKKCFNIEVATWYEQFTEARKCIEKINSASNQGCKWKLYWFFTHHIEIDFLNVLWVIISNGFEIQMKLIDSLKLHKMLKILGTRNITGAHA